MAEGESLLSRIIRKRFTDKLSAPYLDITSVSIEGPNDNPVLAGLLERRFATFDEVREELEKMGYTMGMPERGEDYGRNNAASDVYRNGARVGAISFNTSIDLTQGQPVNTSRPQLKK